MKIYILSFFLLSVISNLSFAYDELTVLDPQNPWMRGPGTVEEANFKINPAGLYAEYSIELTFSAKDLSFSHIDTLEVEFKFDLPLGTIINDLWLWYGEDTLKAIVLDQWTASAIYENIVQRRRDPAILFKRTAVSYELRIFPMAGDESRKIRLNFLVPVNYASQKINLPVPINLINNSFKPLNGFQVLFKESESWRDPVFPEYPDVVFSPLPETSETSGYLVANLLSNHIKANLSLDYENVSGSNIFLGILNQGGYGYYQLAMLPKEVFGLNSTRKAAILIDYDITKSNITLKQVFDNLKIQLMNKMTEQDSFNLIFSNLDIKRASERWVGGDSASIEALYKSLPPNPVSNYSNFTALLNNGIDFLNNNGKEGSIILISNSDQWGEFSVANQLVIDLKKKMEVIYQVYCVDFTQHTSNYYYHGNQYYYGNEYFYITISRSTKGEYFNIRNGNSISDILGLSIQSMDGVINSYDLYTMLENGFCYGRHNINDASTIYLNKPILQVGKFNGSLPFKILVSGIYKSQSFSKFFTIDSSAAQISDTLISEMWAGNYISSLENQPETNSNISEIITYSMSEKILSSYTAFLALEPNDTLLACLSCEDGGDIIIDIEEKPVIPMDLKIEAFPNPFNSQVNLKVVIPQDQNNEETTFLIYNILGEVVKTFEPALSGSGTYDLTWNGISDYGESVSSGIYLFVVQTANKNYTHKIVLMK